MSKGQTGRKPKGNLLGEIDAAMAASSAMSNGASRKTGKQVSTEKQPKRLLSANAREAIAVAQRKCWAKVRHQKKQAERTALAE